MINLCISWSVLCMCQFWPFAPLVCSRAELSTCMIVCVLSFIWTYYASLATTSCWWFMQAAGSRDPFICRAVELFCFKHTDVTLLFLFPWIRHSAHVSCPCIERFAVIDLWPPEAAILPVKVNPDFWSEASPLYSYCLTCSDWLMMLYLQISKHSINVRCISKIRLNN